MTDKPEPLKPTYWLSSDDVEDPGRYREGGYHPIHLGDELHQGRYKIVHKLGYGSYSTVWLVQDQQKDQYAALKIATADARTEGEVLHRLCRIQEWFGHGPDNRWRYIVPEILDKFEIQGPNGNHECVVLEPLGASLSTAFDYLKGGRLPAEVARKVSMQLVEGLSFLHASGVVHGDLHDGNVLFCLPNLSQWTPEQVYACYGKPAKVRFCRRDGQPLTHHAPEYAVRAPFPDDLVPPCLAEARIRIIDFGEAFESVECIPKHLHTPVWFAAPEALFRDPVGPPSDIWALACLLYNVFGNETLFESFLGDRDEILGEMTRALGKLPDRWWNRWEKRAKYFAEDGTAYARDTETSWTDIKSRLRFLTPATLGGLEADEIEAFERILLGMLRFEPDQRMPANEVLRLLPGVCGNNRAQM